MACISFKTVDVFTCVPYKGNPVAVVLKADGFTSDQMQQIASWINLSETTFVVPVTTLGADYHVRILPLVQSFLLQVIQQLERHMHYSKLALLKRREAL